MKITFLGTSAANAFPEAFCSCGNCVRARALGGRSLRKRSSALINDDLLIDLGPDVMAACQMHGLSFTSVSHCLQTHPHADHLDTSHFLSRSPEYGTTGAPLLNFYATGATARQAAHLLERDFAPASFLDDDVCARLNLRIHIIEAMQPFQVGAYRVTAFPASHDRQMECVLYAVERDGRAIFYGTDTSALDEDVWRAFHRFGLRFDVVILDHTYGPEESSADHLGAWTFIQHVARMRAEGLLADGARAFATHIAHQGNPPHPELAAFAEQHGYAPAYDGLVVHS